MKKHFIFLSLILFAFSSCEKAVLEDEIPSEPLTVGTASLTVSTRGGNTESPVTQGNIYIFNQAGNCVELLTTSETSNSATAQLPAGTYTLYAVGSCDLSRFELPTKATAQATSVITRKEGEVMEDLLLKSANVTLEDGESINQTIALEHKVICVNQVEIKKVPSDITKVEVTLSPLYQSIRLNGTYPDSPTESYKITLTKQDDGTTWLSTPQQMLFPSKGTPTIKVSFTTSQGDVRGYSYTASEELPANHHFTISGSYTAEQGISITGILTAAEWGDDCEITFDFDNGNMSVYNPVAGQFCNGYYVVSVDRQARKVVLLAKEKLAYTAPDEATNSTAWRQALTAPMASLAKPTGINGNWRLPTLEEVSIFSKDSQVNAFTNNASPVYFCEDEDVLMWGWTKSTDEGYELKKGKETFYNYFHLRPVIDITF